MVGQEVFAVHVPLKSALPQRRQKRTADLADLEKRLLVRNARVERQRTEPFAKREHRLDERLIRTGFRQNKIVRQRLKKRPAEKTRIVQGPRLLRPVYAFCRAKREEWTQALFFLFENRGRS